MNDLNEEDLLLRDLLASSPSQIDRNDDTIFVYDSDGTGYSGKTLHTLEEKEEKGKTMTEWIDVTKQKPKVFAGTFLVKTFDDRVIKAHWNRDGNLWRQQYGIKGHYWNEAQFPYDRLDGLISHWKPCNYCIPQKHDDKKTLTST